jgi:hypothetical protein
MKRPGYWTLVEKSRAACVAAVETYNRASSPYREESFAILMINAWELLLKARILKENSGKWSSIYAYELKARKNGKPGKRLRVRRGRSGAPLTINITRAYNLVASYAKDRVEDACIQNINALLEIRDVATHFVTRSALLTKVLGEISMAAVRNYVLASQRWFGVRYSDLNIAAIPISFHLDQMKAEAIAKRTPSEVVRFLKHLAQTEQSIGTKPSDFAYSVRVEFDLVKKKSDGALTATIVKEGGDIKINIDDDRIPEAYVWNYKTLTKRLAARYTDFKENAKYHAIRKPLEDNKEFCYLRRLNPKNSKSAKTRFYNPNILAQFDKYYSRKDMLLIPPTPAPPPPVGTIVIDKEKVAGLATGKASGGMLDEDLVG